MPDNTGILDYFKRIERQHLLEIISFVRALIEEYGTEILDTLIEAKQSLTERQWAELAHSRDSCHIDDLLELQWEGSRPLIDSEVVARAPGEVRLKVKHCFWADVFLQWGETEIGRLLYCDDEYASARGFNPGIHLTRSSCLMDGDDCCEHCYRLET